MSKPAIRVEQLKKEFRVTKPREGLRGAVIDLFNRREQSVVAVHDIDLLIPQGEICGYIGENGAGKSTTIKMLCGILVPTSGTIEVNGYVPFKDREKFVQEIGVVFGQRSQLWWDLGVIESFRLLRKVYRVGENDFQKRLNELVDRLALGDLLNRPVRKLSLGQRMRCELAASLLHQPKILFLDEPTIGLDILVKSSIRSFLMEMNREHGTTIMLTTHDLQDIEALCSRVVMLDEGKIIYDGSLDQLKEQFGGGRSVQVQFEHNTLVENVFESTSGLSATWSKPEAQLDDGKTLRVTLDDVNVPISEILERVVKLAGIRDIAILEPNTEDIVREIYRKGV